MSHATRKEVGDCPMYAASLEPYLDGELDPDHAVDMEQHVVACSECAERVALRRAMRLSLKRTTSQKAPPALAAKLCATIAREKARSACTEPPAEALGPNLIRLRYSVGLAAAAGIAFAVGVSHYAQNPERASLGGEARTRAGAVAASIGIDTLLEELIALHARPLPPDTMDPEQLQRFDPLVGVQVRRPAFQPFGASFRGARVHAVSDRGALLQLQYVVPDGKRVTMYVFNPRVVPVDGTRLEERVVRHRSIHMGRLRGYSVAAVEQSGVGYAFASDLDTDESEKLVLAAIQQ